MRSSGHEKPGLDLESVWLMGRGWLGRCRATGENKRDESHSDRATDGQAHEISPRAPCVQNRASEPPGVHTSGISRLSPETPWDAPAAHGRAGARGSTLLGGRYYSIPS